MKSVYLIRFYVYNSVKYIHKVVSILSHYHHPSLGLFGLCGAETTYSWNVNSPLLSPFSLWKPPCSSLSLWFWPLQVYHITEELNIDCLDMHISLSNYYFINIIQVAANIRISFRKKIFLRQVLLCRQDCFYTCYVAQAGSELILLLVEAPKYCYYGGILPHPDSLASFLLRLLNNIHCIIYFMLLCPLFPFADTWDVYSF